MLRHAMPMIVVTCLIVCVGYAQEAAIPSALPGAHADPHIACFDGVYYIYPTTDGIEGWGSSSFTCWSSKDLVHWKNEGVILDFKKDLTWANERAWAPCIARKGGKFYFYYSANQQVGVAVADTPTGPFKDPLGKPLVARGAYHCQTIDPMVFVDDDGSAYLYFGQGNCNIVKLNEDMISFDPNQVKRVTPQGYNEGAFMLKRQGRYYLMWSSYDTRDPRYCVNYAVGPSPMGPFEMAPNTPILKQRGIVKGAGHHSVVQVPGKDQWYIAYHRFRIPNGNGYNREVCISPMHFDSDGWIVPVDVFSPVTSTAAKTCRANGKLKVFILAGQSNMVGFGQVKGSPGTMETYVKSNPADYGHLVDENGKPVVRDDVWIVNISQTDKEQMGWLTTGYGASPEHIGPEYAFGFVMGDYYEDPVLLIKSAWGGRSLYHNFLSPSSAEYPTPQKDGDMGFQYAEVLRHVKEVTGNLKKYYPDYAGQGYEIVGFGWHQGWNDRINPDAVNAYEQNMVNFVKDIRKDLGLAKLPFVIANTGMGGWDNPPRYKERVEKLMNAQLAPADPQKYPEFKGNVAGVETRDYQRTEEESPSKQGYHWMRNWETYYLIGKAMGDSMVELLAGQGAEVR